MARAEPALPKVWRQFANHYGADRTHWYVPKALAASTGSPKPRHIGWVRKLAATGAKMHGAIVAQHIDSNLRAARDAHDTKVYLIEFGMKMGATAV